MWNSQRQKQNSKQETAFFPQFIHFTSSSFKIEQNSATVPQRVVDT